MSRRSGPLRIAFLTTLIMGGSERQMMELARRLPRSRFEVTFVVIGDRGPHAEIVESWGVRLVSLGASRQQGTSFPVFAARVSGKVARYVWWSRREHFDIVDAWLFHGYGLAAVTKPFAGIPVMVAGRRSLSDFKADFGLLERIVDHIARWASDAIVANSSAVVDDVLRREPVERAKLHLIRNGVDIPSPIQPHMRAEIRERWGFGDGHLVVGCVANYRPRKGLERLIQSAARLRVSHPQARYVLVGEGSMRQDLEHLVGVLELAGIVVLHGAELDARALYGAFDVVAQASETEGLPNALLEAAAAGLPIVATAAGGTRDIVIDDQTGLLVPLDDEAAFDEAMGRVLDDAGLRIRLGAAARSHVMVTFGMDRFVAESAALYENLAAAKGLRRA